MNTIQGRFLLLSIEKIPEDSYVPVVIILIIRLIVLGQTNLTIEVMFQERQNELEFVSTIEQFSRFVEIRKLMKGFQESSAKDLI
jgi:hypothetical protein